MSILRSSECLVDYNAHLEPTKLNQTNSLIKPWLMVGGGCLLFVGGAVVLDFLIFLGQFPQSFGLRLISPSGGQSLKSCTNGWKGQRWSDDCHRLPQFWDHWVVQNPGAEYQSLLILLSSPYQWSLTISWWWFQTFILFSLTAEIFTHLNRLTVWAQVETTNQRSWSTCFHVVASWFHFEDSDFQSLDFGR